MSIVVATANVPHRLLHKGLGRDMQRLADIGVTIIGTQESADNDWKVIRPQGWRHWRPDIARHGIVMWDPRKVTMVKKGYETISIAKKGTNPNYRAIVWVHFRVKATGDRIRFGTTHLPAFYNSKAGQRREYDHQEPLAAKWLAGGRNRVLVGDFNGKIPGSRTRNLARVGRWSRQVVSGPHNAKIDYVGTNRRGPWRPGRTRTVQGGSDHRYVVVTLDRS